MHPITIFRHATHEGPGYCTTFLDLHSIPYRLIAIDKCEPIPKSLANTSGLIFMGGPMSVNDPLAWIADALNLIRQAIDAQMPVLGHCLGGQLIAKALGATVAANPVKEIGWHEVTRLGHADAYAWLDPLPPTFTAFHWHGETFSLPAGVTPLFASQFCANQAFALGNALALQCHIEMTLNMVQEWTELDSETLAMPSASVQTAGEMMMDLNNRVAALHRVADVLYTHWIKRLG